MISRNAAMKRRRGEKERAVVCRRCSVGSRRLLRARTETSTVEISAFQILASFQSLEHSTNSWVV